MAGISDLISEWWKQRLLYIMYSIRPKTKLYLTYRTRVMYTRMLTGRKDAFLHPEKYDNVSGYTEPQESEHDFFIIGHTSTSVSLASGLAKGRDLTGGNENIIAVMGMVL